MLLDNPAELATRLDPGQRLLGLDVGAKTIGVALSDGTRTIATPLETIRRTKFKADAGRLVALIEQHAVAGLVIGLPINMNGSEGPRCQSTRQFQRNLAEYVTLPTIFWDERLSTAAVTRMLITADRSRARRRQLVDKLAAAYILQGALDYLKNLPAGGASLE